jgi:hypothetical protein
VQYPLAVARDVLHIVDGDCTRGTLGLAGFANADILSWRDALYTGPVPPLLKLRQLSRVRSRFWTNGKSASELDRRDAALAKHTGYDNIALWFGRDCLLCQLSLMQVLSWFSEHSVPAARISWIALHGGELRPEQIPGAFATRKTVSLNQVRLARRAWQAFRQPSPSGLIRLLKTDLTCIPGLRRAVTRLLQEYPGKRTGLSRMETQLLREFKKRGSARASIAVGSVLVRESIGDTMLFDMLRVLVRAPRPLLRVAAPFIGKFESSEFNVAVLELTEDGRRVLNGRENHIRLNGIDRWIGGTHLQNNNVVWRWSESEKRIVRASKTKAASLR